MLIKEMVRHSDYGKLLIFKYRLFKQRHQKQDDILFLQKKYKKATGNALDLDNPKRFTEKLQWLKLFYRNDLMPICADKSQLPIILEKKGVFNKSIHSFGVWDNVEDIPLDSLPDSFILKATHGSSMHLVVSEKSKINWNLWKRIMRVWLKMDISKEGGEWPYHQVKPRIIAEELIYTDGKLGGTDYKFFCFGGKPLYIQVDTNLLIDHKIDFYDTDWKLLNLKGQYQNSREKINKPSNFDEMYRTARVLSEDFPHVRVDFFVADNDTYISELTFFDGSGMYCMHPDEWDFIWGDNLQLPEANHNLNLLRTYGNT